MLLVASVLRALRVDHPLIHLKLLRNRPFSVAMITMSVFCVGFFGAMLLLPTYFTLVRGESALHAGLLLAPQGLGAMLAMPITGRLADKIAARRIVLPGLGLIVLGMVVFTQVGSTTSYGLLLSALFVMGIGMGCTMMPITSAALQTLRPKDMAKASTATNIVQQTAGAIGSAIMSIILAALLAAKFGVSTSQGQLAATAATLNPQTHTAAASLTADSFATTFLWATVLLALCLIPAFFLPKKRFVSDAAADSAEPVAPPVLMH